MKQAAIRAREAGEKSIRARHIQQVAQTTLLEFKG